jgi:hypothetical protein
MFLKEKRILAAISVLGLFFCSIAAAQSSAVGERAIQGASLSGPHLEASEMFYDFGKLSRSVGSARHEFIFSNTGNEDLVISNLRASCSCAKVSLRTNSGNSPEFGSAGSGLDWKAIVKPGEAATLVIVLDLNSIPAGNEPVSRQAFVVTNDPKSSMVAFKVSLEVMNS